MGQKIDLTTQVQGVLPIANGGAGANAGIQFSDAEVPGGAVNGSNGTFTLLNPPNPPGSLMFFVNGMVQVAGVNLLLNGNTVTIPPPAPGTVLICWYRYLSVSGSLPFTESLSFSDSVVLNLLAARLAVSLQDALQQVDQMSLVYGSSAITDTLVMKDAFRIVLLPLNVTPVDSLTLSEAVVVSLVIPRLLPDSMVLADKFVYFYNSPNGGSDVYAVVDNMLMTEAVVVVVSLPAVTLADPLSMIDSFVVQLR
jgi:hypothetical protein